MLFGQSIDDGVTDWMKGGKAEWVENLSWLKFTIFTPSL
jgi:hypothetical protein